MEVARDVIEHIRENEKIECVEGPAKESGYERVALVGAIGQALRHNRGSVVRHELFLECLEDCLFGQWLHYRITCIVRM